MLITIVTNASNQYTCTEGGVFYDSHGMRRGVLEKVNHDHNGLSKGERIGKYRIVSELGRGGMGVVYLVEDTTLERLVALKVLHPFLCGDPSFVQRFKSEAKAVARLRHPHIVPINSFDVIDDRLVIEMPFLGGRSLGGLFASKCIQSSDLLYFVSDVLDALAYCHEANLVHRDVKPTNVLLDQGGRALLSDFGLVKVLDEKASLSVSGATTPGVFLGTPRFAPPEAWEGGKPTPAWDLYATGVILYEGLNGEPIYKADTPLAFLKELNQRKVAPLKSLRNDVSEKLSDLVESLIEKNSEKRLSDARETRQRLHETPEWALTDEREAPTVFVHLDYDSGATESVLLRAEELGRRSFPWLGWLLAVLLMVIGSVWFLLEREADTALPEKPETAAAAQEVLIPNNVIPTHEMMLSRMRFRLPARATVYDVQGLFNGPDSRQEWLIRQGPDGSIEAVLCKGTLRVLSLDAIEQDDGELVFQGHYGAYTDSTAMEAWTGTVTGKGRWLEPENRILSVSLVFVSEEQTSRWEEQYTALRTEVIDTRFLYDFEKADYLMPLLVNEMIPRNGDWQGKILDWLPSFSHATTTIVSLAQNSSIIVDGIASEPEWLRVQSRGETGFVSGWPEQAGAELQACADDSGVYLLMHATNMPPGGDQLWIALMPGFGVPLRDSKRYVVTRGNEKLKGTRYVDGNTAISWTPDWQISDTTADGKWYCEVFIPYESLGLATAPPRGTLWRLNALLCAPGGNQPSDPTVVWGSPDFDDVVHGALISFGVNGE